MDDKIIQPAFAVFNSPGVYALLLGSGTSRAAGIQTGQEVSDDLIQQLVIMFGEVIENSPGEWYFNRFGEKASYDKVFEKLGKTPADRQAILRKYFEPSQDDLENGRKQPTLVHHAIAWLAKAGYIRVILTTNFDRLIEKALESIGISPKVLSTDDQFSNTEPVHRLAKQQPVIIKIHGDYLDQTLRNTPEELNSYRDSPALCKLLSQIFTDYGLIVCGWSADIDNALVKLAKKYHSKHYSTYWTSYSSDDELLQNAKDIIKARKEKITKIANIDADTFFGELREMVEALHGRDQQPPLTVEIAVARVKKMIPRPEMQVELEEFLRDEYQETSNRLNDRKFIDSIKYLKDQFLENSQNSTYVWRNTIVEFTKATKISINCLIALVWYGRIEHSKLIPSLLLNLYNPETSSIFHAPPLLAVYTVGIISVHLRKWDFLKVLFFSSQMYSIHINNYEYLVNHLIQNTYLDFDRENISFIFDDDPSRFLGGIISQEIRPFLKNYISSDEDFKIALTIFEMLLVLHYLNTSYKREEIPAHVILINRKFVKPITDFLDEVKDTM